MPTLADLLHARAGDHDLGLVFEGERCYSGHIFKLRAHTERLIASARILGFESRLGRIAPGYKADLVMLDLDHPNWLPMNDPVNQLVHTEDGNAVHSVMIDGQGRKCAEWTAGLSSEAISRMRVICASTH